MLEPRPRIAAGLTLYRPDRAVFDALLRSVRPQVARVYVFIDGPAGEAVEEDHLAELAFLDDVEIVQARANKGIATGLNALVEAVRRAGFSRLALFDQDSEAAPDLISRIGETLSELKAMGHRPAAVGALPVAATDSRTRAPRYHRRGQAAGPARSVDFVIVSGSVLDLDAWSAIGPFDERLRMDGVDVEWGLRAWRKGFSVWVRQDQILPHRVGTGLVRIGPIAFPRQSEERMVNYVRSQALCLRLPHMPLRWKLRALSYVPLQAIAFATRSSRPLAVIGRFVRAAWEGLTLRSPKENRK